MKRHIYIIPFLAACGSDADLFPPTGVPFSTPANIADATPNELLPQENATEQAEDGLSTIPTEDSVSQGEARAGEGVDAEASLDEGQGEQEAEPSGEEAVEEVVLPPETLRDAAEISGRFVGVALATFKLNREAYSEAAREFNFITHENDMKWQVVEPQPGEFNFANADATIDFAEANDMQVKGHTLVWHSQLPGWAQQLGSRQEALAAMELHIATVVGRYRGRIHSYDVVNEAFTDGGNPRLRGSAPGDEAAGIGPDSPFRRLIGADYIDRAFQLARAADPEALLFYNDYNGEGMNAKSNAIFQMVQGMVERGIPIDGVGLQMHINAGGDNGRSADDVAQNIERITNLGLQVHITEMDARLCGDGSIEQRRQQQSERFAGIVKVCTDEPLCTAITMWGVADPDSWRNDDCDGGTSEPLLFNADYQPKPAYAGVFDALVAATTNVP